MTDDRPLHRMWLTEEDIAEAAIWVSVVAESIAKGDERAGANALAARLIDDLDLPDTPAIRKLLERVSAVTVAAARQSHAAAARVKANELRAQQKPGRPGAKGRKRKR
jgi:hypothetical protein